MTVICYLFLPWASIFKSVKWREKRAYKRHAQSRGPKTQGPSALLSLPISLFLSVASPPSPAEAPENLQPVFLRTTIPAGGIAGITLGVLIGVTPTGVAGFFVRVMRSQVSALGSSEVTELRRSVWGVQRAALLEAM